MQATLRATGEPRRPARERPTVERSRPRHVTNSPMTATKIAARSPRTATSATPSAALVAAAAMLRTWPSTAIASGAQMGGFEALARSHPADGCACAWKGAASGSRDAADEGAVLAILDGDGGRAAVGARRRVQARRRDGGIAMIGDARARRGEVATDFIIQAPTFGDERRTRLIASTLLAIAASAASLGGDASQRPDYRAALGCAYRPTPGRSLSDGRYVR